MVTYSSVWFRIVLRKKTANSSMVHLDVSSFCLTRKNEKKKKNLISLGFNFLDIINDVQRYVATKAIKFHPMTEFCSLRKHEKTKNNDITKSIECHWSNWIIIVFPRIFVFVLRCPTFGICNIDWFVIGKHALDDLDEQNNHYVTCLFFWLVWSKQFRESFRLLQSQLKWKKRKTKQNSFLFWQNCHNWIDRTLSDFLYFSLTWHITKTFRIEYHAIAPFKVSPKFRPGNSFFVDK